MLKEGCLTYLQLVSITFVDLLKGRGVEKSIPKAIDCLKLAADSGSNFARGHLAELLFRLKLFSEAVQYAKMAYDQYKSEGIFEDASELEGLTISCYIPGRCLLVSKLQATALNFFQLGHGAPKDKETGTLMIKLCADLDRASCRRKSFTR